MVVLVHLLQIKVTTILVSVYVIMIYYIFMTPLLNIRDIYTYVYLGYTLVFFGYFEDYIPMISCSQVDKL